MARVKFSEVLAFAQSSQAERLVGGWDDDEGGVGPAGVPIGAVRPSAVAYEAPFDVGRDESPKVAGSLSGCGSWDVLCSGSVMDQLRGAVRDLCQDPPVGNTGDKMTLSVHLHYAQVSIFKDVESVADVLCREMFSDYVGFDESPLDRFELLEHGAGYYKFVRVGPNGLSISSGNRSGSEETAVRFSGETFDVFGDEAFQRFIRSVHDAGWRWHLSRVDNAFDGVDFSPVKVFRAILRGDVRSASERATLKLMHTPLGDDAGSTVNFGRRGSDNFLRVYDRRGFTRVEHELRGEKAKMFGLVLVANSVEYYRTAAMGGLRQFFDLVDRGSSSNVGRRKLLGWWSSFVGNVGRLRVNLSNTINRLSEAREVSVGEVAAKVKRIMRSAATLFDVLGVEKFVELVIDPGRRKLQTGDLVRMRALREVVEREASIFEQDVREFFYRALRVRLLC